jgi:hypothetical protein
MSLSGYGYCAFGGAMSQHALPIGLNGGRIMPEAGRGCQKITLNVSVISVLTEITDGVSVRT